MKTNEWARLLASRGYVNQQLLATLARHPKFLKRSLPARERETVILRMGLLCRAEYEWGHHVSIGKRTGGKQAGLALKKSGGSRLLDLTVTTGQYTLVSMALNSCAVQLEDGFEGFPDGVEG